MQFSKLIPQYIAASNYGAILGMFMIPAVATGMDKIPLTVSFIKILPKYGYRSQNSLIHTILADYRCSYCNCWICPIDLHASQAENATYICSSH
jgi:hypothetical protein